LSSAPFLHNNAGEFTGDPSVESSLHDAGKLLWPEKRLAKPLIWRTENECPCTAKKNFKATQRFRGQDGYVKIGPIPRNTPVNLIANLEPDPLKWPRCSELAPALIKIPPTISSEAAAVGKVIPDFSQPTSALISSRTCITSAPISRSDKRALLNTQNLYQRRKLCPTMFPNAENVWVELVICSPKVWPAKSEGKPEEQRSSHRAPPIHRTCDFVTTSLAGKVFDRAKACGTIRLRIKRHTAKVYKGDSWMMEE
jgi:hypothetical protein